MIKITAAKFLPYSYVGRWITNSFLVRGEYRGSSMRLQNCRCAMLLEGDGVLELSLRDI
jgi:hypothetical protein